MHSGGGCLSGGCGNSQFSQYPLHHPRARHSSGQPIEVGIGLGGVLLLPVMIGSGRKTLKVLLFEGPGVVLPEKPGGKIKVPLEVPLPEIPGGKKMLPLEVLLPEIPVGMTMTPSAVVLVWTEVGLLLGAALPNDCAAELP
jgi:hypothetical protein